MKLKPFYNLLSLLVSLLLVSSGPAFAQQPVFGRGGQKNQIDLRRKPGQNHVSATQANELDDILSYWPLNDGPGATNFLDVVGENHGECQAGTCPDAIVDGKVNGAFRFKEGDRIDVPHDSRLDWTNTSSFSIELWVKTTQICGTNEARTVFIGKYSLPGSWWVGCDTSRATFHMRDSLTETFTVYSNTLISDGDWHHIVAVRDGDQNTNLLYVDGVLEKSHQTYFTGDFTNPNKINIGYYNAHPDFYYFEGSLDEITIYNRILSAEEVRDHFEGNGPSKINYPPIVTNPGDQTSFAGDIVTLHIEAVDNEGDLLSFNSHGLPPNLVINPVTGVITGTIAKVASSDNYRKDFEVTVTVCEDNGNSKDIQFAWHVAMRMNYLPVVVRNP
jgi:hypothetical protein